MTLDQGPDCHENIGRVAGSVEDVTVQTRGQIDAKVSVLFFYANFI